MTKRDKQASEYASEELRDGAVTGRETVLLTDAEREAIRMMATYCDTNSWSILHKRWGSTLRHLLERTK